VVELLIFVVLVYSTVTFKKFTEVIGGQEKDMYEFLAKKEASYVFKRQKELHATARPMYFLYSVSSFLNVQFVFVQKEK